MPRDSSAKVDEFGRGGIRQGQVLDDELLGVPAGVQCFIQHVGVQEVVEEPTCPAVEWEHELVEHGKAYPEATSVVAEKVLV